MPLKIQKSKVDGPLLCFISTLEYRINGGGVRIIGGLEMVRYNNNRGGWNNRGGGGVGEIENSRFLSEQVSFTYLCEQ